MPRNAIEVLAADHAELDHLFDRVSGVDEDRVLVLKQLVSKLSAHVAMEKQLVVPAAKDELPGGGEIAERLSDYHDAVDRVLVLIERRKVDSPDMPELVTELLDLTRAHIADADATVLPALRSGYSSEQLVALGQRMDSDERDLLTHPHPHLPDTGPIAGVARKVAAALDRSRDDTTDLNRASD